MDLLSYFSCLARVNTEQLASSWEVTRNRSHPARRWITVRAARYTAQMSPLGSPRDPAVPCAGDGDIEPRALLPPRADRQGGGFTLTRNLAHFALFGTQTEAPGGGSSRLCHCHVPLQPGEPWSPPRGGANRRSRRPSHDRMWNNPRSYVKWLAPPPPSVRR